MMNKVLCLFVIMVYLVMSVTEVVLSDGEDKVNHRRRLVVLPTLWTYTFLRCRVDSDPNCRPFHSDIGNDSGKRRRLQTGEMVDTVCEKSTTLIENETLETFIGLLRNLDSTNQDTMNEVMSSIVDACYEAGLPECSLYVYLMNTLDEDGVMLKGAWVDSFGDLRDKQTACSVIVNFVNEHLSNQSVELDDDYDITVQDGAFVVIKKNAGLVRRLAGVAAAGAAATGVFLGHLCKSFVNGPMPIDLIA